ncbi:ABC transporter permease subunit [Pyrococcus yayanosii]|uniref:ABC transporter permease subunit n=1 Tax=Pyrococcus yayanosii TaxID=1008460 RepID=UPI001ED91EFB|nr:ABC transporter permease subunit [Pyrococcus yayanosii]
MEGIREVRYVHKYTDWPNDVVFYDVPKGSLITIIRPDGKKVTFKVPSKKERLSLNIYAKHAIVSQLDIPPEKAVLKTATFLLFSTEDFDVLKGEYIFRIEVDQHIRLEIKGNCYGLLGTDRYGRDMWVGFVAGMNNTIILSLLISGLTLIFGITLGIISAYIRGMDLILEVLAAIPMPPFFVVLVWLVSTQGIGYNVNVSTLDFVLIFTILTFGRFAKSIKMITLKEKAMEYTRAGLALGASEAWIIRKYIIKPVLEFSARHVTFIIARTISQISILGFFGLSPGVNWGSYLIEVMREGVLYGSNWWWILAPVIAMGLLSLGLALLSENLPES